MFKLSIAGRSFEINAKTDNQLLRMIKRFWSGVGTNLDTAININYIHNTSYIHNIAEQPVVEKLNNRASKMKYLLLNLEVNLLMNEVLPDATGLPPSRLRSSAIFLRSLVCPLWKVLRALEPLFNLGTCGTWADVPCLRGAVLKQDKTIWISATTCWCHTAKYTINISASCKCK